MMGGNTTETLASRGTAERFKGDLTRDTEFAKAGGKMFGNYQSSGSLLG